MERDQAFFSLFSGPVTPVAICLVHMDTEKLHKEAAGWCSL